MSYTFSLSRRSLPVRCLCLLLIVLVLWCFFMVPRASAVALEATSVAYAGLLVGTLLVGAGVAFSNPGDMAKAGNAMYRTLQKGNEAIASKIAAISAWAVEHGKAIGSAALRIGKDMYQAIVDTYNSLFTSVSYDVTRDNYSKFMTAFNAANVQSVTISCRVSGEDVSYTLSYVEGSDSFGAYIMLLVDGAENRKVVYDRYAVWKNYKFDYMTVSGNSRDSYMKFGTHYRYGDSLDNMFGAESSSEGREIVSFPFSVSCKVAAPDVVYPSDDYLVRMPDIPSVDSATGDVTYPDSIAYTKDAVAAPYPIGDDGVKVPDIPFDIPVDQTSGKPMDDTGTDTDTPSKPGEGTDTGSNTGLLQKILDLLKNFFDSPSDFRLNMDGFRNLAIKDKFPFCIPFDMVDSVKQFAADAADYQFRVKLDTQYFKVDHVVDLTPLAVPLAFFRYLVVAWFAWVLMSRTHDLMKW